LLKEVYTGVNFLFAFHICGTKNQINMKQKFLLSLVLVCTFIVSGHAQIKKGGIWLGGSIGYSEQKTDYDGSTSDTKSRTFVISPAIGKVVKDNLVVGVSLSYYNSKTENNSSSSTIDQKGKSYGGGVFVRQYVPVINRLYIFGQGNANYSSIRINETQRDYYGIPTKYKSKGWSSGLGITPGVAVSITKNLLIESGFNNLFYVSYSKNKTSLDSPSAPKTTTSNFSAGVSLENQSAFYLGFRWLINNKG
jgi:hypothetical protein